MQRIALRVSVMLALVSSFLVAFPVAPARATSAVGSFEIDANEVDSAPGEPIDWSTPPPNLTTYSDFTDASDTAFGPGSAEQAPGGWSCVLSDVAGKDDIASGRLARRIIGNKEYLYLSFTRQAANGDAHVDWELNQSTANNPACPVLPQRTDGDIVVTFDSSGSNVTVRAFRWAFTGPGVGTFTPVAVGSMGVAWDAAINIPNTIAGHIDGDFGEIALNVTDTIGPVCTKFVTTHMQTRSGLAIDSTLLDHSQREHLKIGGCIDTGTTLSVSKVACPTAVVSGGLLTYTISYSNTGLNPAAGVTLVDTIPSGTQVADAGGGTVNGNQVSWDVGTVNSNQGGTRTLVLLVTAANGASLLNTVTVTAANAPTAQATTTTNVSNAGALTHGSAYGLDVDLLSIPLIDELNKVSTVAPGAPQAASKTTAVLGVLGAVGANVARQTSNSAVTSQATSTATSETTALNLLGGAITADLVRGVSQSVATSTSATSNSAGSTFANLRINGVPVTNVAPNTSITVKNPLPLLGTQTLATAVLYEEVKSATFVNGKFTATHSVNMLRVTLLSRFLTLPAGAVIIVAHADSDATYPSGLACGTAPSTVSGEAFAAFAQGTLGGNPLAVTKVGDAVITPLGGSDSNTLAGVFLPGAATSGTAVDTTSGSITPNPTATAHSVVNGTDVLAGLVTADVLDVASTSNSNGTTASTTFATTFANLKVNNVTISAQVAPNSTISIPQGGGVVLVVLNEQILEGNGVKDTGGTVNAVHVYVLNSSSVVTAEVIVASAHSDAHKA